LQNPGTSHTEKLTENKRNHVAITVEFV